MLYVNLERVKGHHRPTELFKSGKHLRWLKTVTADSPRGSDRAVLSKMVSVSDCTGLRQQVESSKVMAWLEGLQEKRLFSLKTRWQHDSGWVSFR